MSLNWPKPHHNSVPEFQVSAWPFITSSVTVANQAVKISFPYVTQWIQVKNTDPASSNDIRFGFTQNGVNSGNYQILAAGKTVSAQTPILHVKCTEIWVRGDTFSSVSPFSVIAGLTNVQVGDLPTISGSNGFIGVG